MLKTTSTQRKSNWLFLSGLFLASFSTMFTISGSGVFTAKAVVELNGLGFLGLVFTLESVARCLMLPLSGKLGDKYGRKGLFLISVACYIVSSVVCGLASSIYMLLVGRTLMGMTWGLFYSNMFTMITDVFDQNESPKMTSYMQSVGIAAMLAAGPLTGLFIDLWSWRVALFVPIPFLVLSWLMIIKAMPKQQNFVSDSIDVLGIVFTGLAIIPFSLVLSLGGNTYAWSSPIIIGMLIISIISLIILIAVEKKAKNPIFPSKILKNKNYMLVFALSALFTMISASGNYLPTFAQTVLNTNATISGILSLPSLVVGLIGSLIVGNYIAKKKKYKPIFIWFALATLAGALMFFRFGETTAIWFILVSCAVLGIGQGVNLVAPMTYPTSKLTTNMIATGIAFMTFGQVISNTIANAIFGAIAVTGLAYVFQSCIVLAVLMAVIMLIYKDE